MEDASFRKFYRFILNKNSKIIVSSKREKYQNLVAYTAINKFLRRNKINNALIVVDLNSKKNIELSARNIANIKLIEAYYLSTYDVLKYKQIMFTQSSTKELEKRLLDHE